MRKSVSIESVIGTGDKGKGSKIFCGLLLAIGLGWATLAYLDGRQKDYEERIVGALRFLDGTIETSWEFEADLYAPTMEPRPEPGHWVLSGIMVARDSESGRKSDRTDSGYFSASLESICLDPVGPACWRLEKLAVDGQVIIISELVNSDRTVTPDDGSKETAIAISVPRGPSPPNQSETTVTMQTMTTSLRRLPPRLVRSVCRASMRAPHATRISAETGSSLPTRVFACRWSNSPRTA